MVEPLERLLDAPDAYFIKCWVTHEDTGSICPFGAIVKSEESFKGSMANYRVHLSAHFHGTRLQEDEEIKTVNTDEFVGAVLASGYPYYRLTKPGSQLKAIMERSGIATCSRTTFIKRAEALAASIGEQIFYLTRGVVAHIQIDASPSKLKHDFVETILTYMKEDNEYKRISFGIIQTKGVMSADSYTQFLKAILDAFEARTAGTSDSLVPCLRSSSGTAELVIASSQSDAGPGASNCFLDRFSCQQHVLCTTHGMNRIQYDAIENFPLAKMQLEACRAVVKESRRTKENRSILEDSGITSPPGFRKVRWNTCFKLLEWTFKYCNSNLSALIGHKDLRYLSIKYLLASLKPLSDYVVHSQVFGPGDAYALTWELLQCTARFIDEDKGYFHYPSMTDSGKIEWSYNVEFKALPFAELSTWEDFSPLRRYIAGRLLGRFFDGAFNIQEDIKSSLPPNSTRKSNLFDNIYVLATFALTPARFSFLKAFGIANDQEHERIAAAAAQALLSFHKRLDPDYFIRSMSHDEAGSCTKQIKLDYAMFGPKNAQNPPVDPIERHYWAVKSFVESSNLASIFQEYHSKASTDTMATKRQIFCKAWIEEAQNAFKNEDWIAKVLRIVLSKPLTSVLCETNFKIAQAILSSGRLAMKRSMLRAYVLAQTSPELLTVGEARVNEKKNTRRNITLNDFWGRTKSSAFTPSSVLPTNAAHVSRNVPASVEFATDEANTFSEEEPDVSMDMCSTGEESSYSNKERLAQNMTRNETLRAELRRSGRTRTVNSRVEALLSQSRNNAIIEQNTDKCEASEEKFDSEAWESENSEYSDEDN